MSGVLLSVPGIDFQMHNSVFLIAHFHNVIIGGVVFGYFAGFTYWFPKMFGYVLNERLGKYAFWCWIIGFFIAFIPLYILGALGMTRRLYHYSTETGFQPFLILAWFGSIIISIGLIFQVLQLFISIKNRNKNTITDGDPWNARTLEWTTSSPVAFYNFPHIPIVNSIDDFWEKKQRGFNIRNYLRNNVIKYTDISMPKNTNLGFIIAIFSFLFGFSMIWHIWWATLCSIIGIILLIIRRSYDYDINYYVKANEIEIIENKIHRVKL